MAVEVGSAYVSIVPSARGFTRKLRSEMSPSRFGGIGRGIGSTIGAGVVGAMGGIGRRVRGALATTMRAAGRGAAIAFGAGVAAAGAAVFKGFSTLASLEQSQIAFETLLGDPEVAKGFIKDLTEFAKKTPFELPGLVDASRQLIGSEVALKDVLPTLQAFGDATGALGLNQEQFGRIMLATTQAIGKGKFQAEELLQITEAGIPIWPILARAMGKTVPELQEMSKAGELLAEDVMPKLRKQMEEEFGGAMERQSRTITGLLSTLWDTINIGLATAVEPFQDQLKSGLTAAIGGVGRALEWVVPKIATFARWIANRLVPWIRDEAAPALADFGRTALRWFRDHVVPAFQEFVDAVRDNWPAIQRIIDNVGRVVSAVAGTFAAQLGAMTQTSSTEGSAISRFVDAIVVAIEGITDVTADVLEFVERNWPAIREVIGTTAEVLRGDMSGLAEGIRNAFSGLGWYVGEIMEDVVNNVITALNQILGSLSDFGAAIPGVGAIFGSISPSLPPVNFDWGDPPRMPGTTAPGGIAAGDSTFDSGFADNRTMASGQVNNFYITPDDGPTADAVADRLRRQRLAYR